MTKTFALISRNLLKPGKQTANCKKGCRWLVGLLLPALLLLTGVTNKLYADVTLTSVAVPAGNINQGTNNNVVYIVQMSVTSTAVSVNNVQFSLAGTYDNNDLSTVLVYFNATAATFAGSTFLGSAVATFAAPHSYSINLTRAMAAGSTGYFIIVTNVTATATDNHTVLINGATNPLVFNFTAAPVLINNQTNASGPQTIQAADITVVSSAVAAGNINQGTNSNLVYVAQLTVATADVSVNNVQFTLAGTYDANDLSTALVYFNPTAPTFAGSSFQGSAVATFAAPHSYSINFSSAVAMAAGSTGYFLILTNVAANATDNNTVLINGATNPVAVNFTTAPNITNNQTNASGAQTIQAADITLSTSPVAANTFMPGTNNNIVYIAQMSVATGPVTVDNVQFSLAGTHDANDLETVLVYFNAATPTFSNSTFLGSAVASFAAPHTYSINIAGAPVMAVGSTGYYLIVVNVATGSTVGNTVLINGASNPVIFSFITSPNIINNQTNNGGLHTLPVNFISINAISKNTGVEVAWKVGDELNVDKYIVQKSVDGNSFAPIGTVIARGGSNTTTGYQFADANPSAGNNFYRVQVLNRDGKIAYSPIVKIKLAGGDPGISIYPNPVLNTNRLHLSLQYLKTGTYSFSLFNSYGQRVAAKTIYHAGGNSTQAFGLPALAAGTYRIELRGSNQRFIQSLMVE